MQNSPTTRQEEHDAHIAAMKKAVDESYRLVSAMIAIQNWEKAIMPQDINNDRSENG